MNKNFVVKKEKLLTTREASQILGIAEKEIIELANKNLIAHFKLGGEFLRFRRNDLLRVKPAIKKKYNLSEKKHSRWEFLREFIYFNDFYILSGALIAALLYFIAKDFFIAY